MLENILGKVRDFTRDISVKNKVPETVSSLPIKVLTTFGADGPSKNLN